MLALLLLHANAEVAGDRLIDELWGDAPPGDAPAALQAHVSRLRRLLGPDAITTTARGYRIDAGPQELDLLRFRELVAEGRQRLGGAGASAALTEALALWRGRPLADIEDLPFLAEPIRELDELWLQATELRIEADLQEGRHAGVVTELSALVRRHPLRERLRALSMLALYRCGRQAEALDVYSDLRRTLDSELGLAPSTELRELQEAILRQDPSLDRRPPASRHPGRRLRVLPVVAAGAVALAAAAAVVATRGDPSPPPPAPSDGGFVAAVSPRTGAVEARVAVGKAPTAVAFGGGRVWVVNGDDQTVSRVDPSTRTAETFAIGSPPTGVAAGADAVWVGRGEPLTGSQAHGVVMTALARLDPTTRAPRGTIALPLAGPRRSDAVADHLTAGAGALWAIAPDERVLRIDPRTDRVTGIAGVRATAIAADGPAVWALASDGTVARIDGSTNAVTARGRVQASAVASITAGAGGAWVSAPADGTLWHITPGPGDRLVMRTLPIATGTTALAYGAGAVWAVNPLRGTLARIEGDRVARTIPIGGYPRALAVGAGAVWVATAGDASPAAGGAAGIASCEPPFTGGGGPPQRLLVSDLPLQGGLELSSRQMVDAMAYVLRRHGFRAGRWRVALQSCDDALASTRLPDATKCAANARAYARAAAVMAVLGPLNSDCARAAVTELGRARDPLPMISPLATDPQLTRARSTFLRVIPPDDAQVAALALTAKRRGGPVYVLDDGDDEYGRPLAARFAGAAERLGLVIAGRGHWDPAANSQARLASRVARAHPAAVFLGGGIDTGGPEVVKALRARLDPGVTLLVPDGFTPVSALSARAGEAARGVLMALTGVAAVDQLGPAGRAFADDLARSLGGAPVEPSAVYAAETMEVALDALARSDGTRASMRDALFATRIDDGLLGRVSFDAHGDIAIDPITVLRVEPGARAIAGFPDVVAETVEHVPAALAG